MSMTAEDESAQDRISFLKLQRKEIWCLMRGLKITKVQKLENKK